ncbi:MAG TPA: hypothetical protein VFC79_08995, partial [Tissierellaceae bacterium]|nr:hypothetical protein [Tissierellaceae bacterium]
MANFIFEKYTIGKRAVEEWLNSSTEQSDSEHQMYSRYGISKNPPFSYIYYEPFVTVKPYTSVTGHTKSGDVRIKRSYSFDFLKTIWYGLSTKDAKGDFIENVVGTDVEYPLKGVSGDYWYVRTNQLDDVATITQPNGGETLNSEYEIKWTRTSTDTNTDIEISFNNGLTWKRIASNTEGTNYTYDFINEQETSVARIRTRAIKGEAVGSWNINSGVFTILHDFAPQAPTNLSPSSVILSREDIIRLSWQHNHPNDSSKFDLRWSTDQINWNDISRTNTNQYFDVAAETFTEGNIHWQVRTYSDAGISSTWSNVAVFIAATPSDAPIITSPSSTVIARPVITWSQADQTEYQIIIVNSVNEEVWNTGEIVSANKAKTVGVALLNNSTYKVKLRTKTALGLWTDYAEQTLTVSYTPPAVPTVELIDEGVYISIDITNPTPTGTEPAVTCHDIYRDGIRIATNI